MRPKKSLVKEKLEHREALQD
jgi:hypothetical protein